MPDVTQQHRVRQHQARKAQLTLQLALVLDMQLLADQRVPQPQGAVKHLSPVALVQRYGAHVGGLDCVEARSAAHFIALALAGREVGGVLRDVEARHDCSSA